MKIDCTSNNGKPCLNCEAWMAGFRAGALSRPGGAVKHPGPCPRPSHLWFAHNFAPFCAACRTLAAWLDTRKARR